MAKSLKHSMMPIIKNSIDDGCLVNVTCGFCGRKFGSVEEAKKCESKHRNYSIRKGFYKEDTKK